MSISLRSWESCRSLDRLISSVISMSSDGVKAYGLIVPAEAATNMLAHLWSVATSRFCMCLAMALRSNSMLSDIIDM